jgi:hypothetical protein
MSSCKEINSELIPKKTIFNIELDISKGVCRKSCIDSLRNGGSVNGYDWVQDLANIIEKG